MRLMVMTMLLAAAGTTCHAGDFDWVLSTWYAKSHRQVKAADGSLTWSDGMLVQTARPWLGSDIGHVDEIRVDGKLAGSSVRLHDLANDRWSDYWVSAADGRLQDPMWGKVNAHGSVFFGADVVDGRPVRVRYTWSGVDTPHPRWVQAFSSDEGRTWDDNWIADFGRAPVRVVAAPIIEWRGNRDFDFILGRWDVRSRRLKQPLQGSREWTEGRAERVAIPMLDGMGNRDEVLVDGKPVGGSLRLYHAARHRWAIYWASVRDGVLQPPVWGRFENGSGVFEGDDLLDGKPIRVRVTWAQTRSGHPHWERAFSADGGRTWEANWTMDFSRPAP